EQRTLARLPKVAESHMNKSARLAGELLWPSSRPIRLIIVGKMSGITTILFDIGGVLLTDGWGHDSRRAAAAQFKLDWDDFSDRHEKVAHMIETNRLALERYFDLVIFYRPRSFC